MQITRHQAFASATISIPLIILAALLLTIPIFVYGVPRGNDLQQHFQFALTFYNSLLAGDLFPSLSSSTNHGFGDVGVRFYPPLSYYVLAVFRMLIGNWHDATAAAFLFWFAVGGVGVFLWAREHFEDGGALAAALAYMIAPYHVNEIYNASFFAEFAGAGVLPFCFLFVSRIARGLNLADLIGLAVAYALLILTHLPTAIIGSVGLATYAVFSLPRTQAIKRSASMALSVVIALGLSSFYLIKVVTELPFVNHAGTDFVARAYDFRLNFLASYFYVQADTYNDRFLWFTDLMFVVAIGLFVPSLLFYVFRTPSPIGLAKVKSVTAVFLVGVFFATPVSSFVWENVLFLQKIQFPFRWMILVNVAGAFFIAAGFREIVNTFASRFRPIALLATGIIAVAVAFTATQVIRPAIFIPKEGFDEYVESLTDEVSYKCWLAVWAKESAFSNKNDVTSDGRAISVLPAATYKRRFDVGPGEPGSARLALFYYPNWKAEVNGNIVPVLPGDDGAIVVELPAAASTVRVYFREPITVRASATMSAFSWLVVLAITFFLLFRRCAKYVNSHTNRKLI